MILHSCSYQSACFSEVRDGKLTLLMLPAIEETRTIEKANINRTCCVCSIEGCALLRF